jgi:hypothetical protein
LQTYILAIELPNTVDSMIWTRTGIFHILKTL